MKHDICTFVAGCHTCQCNKGETVKTLGTLQLLPLPPTIWTNSFMNFIVVLPKSKNHSFIMVVVDHLSKYANFCALQHPFTTSTVAQIFMANIFKLPGMPHSTVSNCGPTFTSNLWQELFRLQGTQLQLSKTYHPHKNGQIKVVNKCLETYFRCFTFGRQHQWFQ